MLGYIKHSFIFLTNIGTMNNTFDYK